MYTAAAAPAELMGRLRSPNAHFVISANQIRSIFQTTIDGQLTVGKDVIPLALAGKVYGYKAMADYGVREWGQRNPRTLGYKLMQASMLATDPALASQSRLAAAREFAIHEQRNLNPMWSALKSESLGSVGEIAMWMGKTRLPIGTLGNEIGVIEPPKGANPETLEGRLAIANNGFAWIQKNILSSSAPSGNPGKFVSSLGVFFNGRYLGPPGR
jgi:hypothetical protein